MAYEAQFLFPTCRAAGLDVRASLRNTPRPSGDMREHQEAHPMVVDLSVWEAGTCLMRTPAFAELKLGDVLVLDESNVPLLTHDGPNERLVLARTRLEGGHGYFPQEHQLTYTHSGRPTHLLYDQLPVGAPDKPTAPIVLLAPKVWVGGAVRTYVAFATAGRDGLEAEPHEVELTILGEDGTCLHTGTLSERRNGVILVDVTARLGITDGPSEAPRLVTVGARGGAAQFAILTFVVNERTGACALEHSLSPHYYAKEGRDRLRAEALVFGNALRAGGLS